MLSAFPPKRPVFHEAFGVWRSGRRADPMLRHCWPNSHVLPSLSGQRGARGQYLALCGDRRPPSGQTGQPRVPPPPRRQCVGCAQHEASPPPTRHTDQRRPLPGGTAEAARGCLRAGAPRVSPCRCRLPAGCCVWVSLCHSCRTSVGVVGWVPVRRKPARCAWGSVRPGLGGPRGPQSEACGERRRRAAWAGVCSQVASQALVSVAKERGVAPGRRLGALVGAPTFTESAWASPQTVIVTLNRVNVRSQFTIPMEIVHSGYDFPSERFSSLSAGVSLHASHPRQSRGRSRPAPAAGVRTANFLSDTCHAHVWELISHCLRQSAGRLGNSLRSRSAADSAGAARSCLKQSWRR